jgi:hypothetical protein
VGQSRSSIALEVKSKSTDSILEVSVLVYSSCLLETYPFLAVKNPRNDSVLAYGPLDSFGQPGGTIDSYYVQIVNPPLKLQDLSFQMASKMNSQRDPLALSLLHSPGDLKLKKLTYLAQEHALQIEVSKGLKYGALFLFAGRKILAQEPIRQKKRRKTWTISLPRDLSPEESLSLWIGGYKKSQRRGPVLKKMELKPIQQ